MAPDNHVEHHKNLTSQIGCSACQTSPCRFFFQGTLWEVLLVCTVTDEEAQAPDPLIGPVSGSAAIGLHWIHDAGLGVSRINAIGSLMTNDSCACTELAQAAVTPGPVDLHRAVSPRPSAIPSARLLALHIRATPLHYVVAALPQSTRVDGGATSRPGRVAAVNEVFGFRQ